MEFFPLLSFLFPYQVERVIETVTRTAIEEVINDCNIGYAFIYEQISLLFFIKVNERCSNEIWFSLEDGVSNSLFFVSVCISILENFDENLFSGDILFVKDKRNEF